MGWIPSGKGILTHTLIAMMAFSGVAAAKDSPVAEAEVPVVVERIQDGFDSLYLIAGAIPAKQEMEFVRTLAESRAGNMALLVSDSSDPALKSAASTGRLSKISTFVASTLESTALWKSRIVPENLRGQIAARLKSVTDYGKKHRFGIFWGVFHSGTVSSFAAYASSSVEAGVGLFAGLVLWDLFLFTQPDKWGKALKWGGDSFRNAFSKVFSYFGRPLNDYEKKAYEVTGEFGVSWAASSVTSGAVLLAAGSFSLSGAVWYGLITNYNVWDSVILKKQRNRRVDDQFVKNYYSTQFFFGSLLEFASYAQVPYAQTFLVSTVLSGLTYLSVGREVERGFLSRARMVRDQRRQRNEQPVPCEKLLGHYVAEFNTASMGDE